MNPPVNPSNQPQSGARVIDSHTGGEPTRVLVSGGPDLGRGSMADRLHCFRHQHDHWRRALATEPRGTCTGTSAKLACLAADGALAPGQVWHQESVIGSVFAAHYELANPG